MNLNLISSRSNNNTEQVAISGWRAYLPTNLFKATTTATSPTEDQDSSDSDDEPLDLSDEEIDANEAYDLMLGLPKELSFSAPNEPPSKPISSPPSAINVEKNKRNSITLNQMKPIFTETNPTNNILKPIVPLPALIHTNGESKEFRTLRPKPALPPKPTYAEHKDTFSFSRVEAKLNTSKLLELSYQKLKKGSRKSTRLSLRHTLLVHLTIDRIQEGKTVKRNPKRTPPKPTAQAIVPPPIPPKPITSILLPNIKTTMKEKEKEEIPMPVPALIKKVSHKNKSGLTIQPFPYLSDKINEEQPLDLTSDDCPLIYLLNPPISPPPKAIYAW